MSRLLPCRASTAASLILAAGSAAALGARRRRGLKRPQTGPQGAKLEEPARRLFHLEQLLRNPEQASNLGLDKGDLAFLRSKLKRPLRRRWPGRRPGRAFRDRRAAARRPSTGRSSMGRRRSDYDTLTFVTDSLTAGARPEHRRRRLLAVALCAEPWITGCAYQRGAGLPEHQAQGRGRSRRPGLCGSPERVRDRRARRRHGASASRCR